MRTNLSNYDSGSKFKNFFRNNGFMVALVIIIIANLLLSGRSITNPLTDFKEWLIELLLIVPGIIIGITVHEFAHAFVAYKLGDSTPKVQGRVTLNPIKHIDPIGLIALLFIRFGWGKPVQVNPYAFKHPRRDNFFVDIAGVVTNFLVAIIFSGVLYVISIQAGAIINSGLSVVTFNYIYTIIYFVVWFNLVLMIFNLLPVPPLDGFGIVTEIFNLRGTAIYNTVYNMGFPILIVLIIFNVPSRVIGPIVQTLFDFVTGIFFGF